MRAAVLVFAFALAACQTPCPAPTSETTTAVTFACEDGSDLQVTMSTETAVIVQEGYTTLTLPARITGSGFRYSDDGAELRGRMNDTRWTRPGAAETLCSRTE